MIISEYCIKCDGYLLLDTFVYFPKFPQSIGINLNIREKILGLKKKTHIKMPTRKPTEVYVDIRVKSFLAPSLEN